LPFSTVNTDNAGITIFNFGIAPENIQIPQSKPTLCGIRRSKLSEQQQILVPKAKSA
jgi:hypothetical protein